MSDQPTQICDNCRKPVPQSKIATHFGYCRRNIKKCNTCGEMYDINFTQDHEEEFHKMIPCKHCKKTFKPNQVHSHQNNCASKTQYCQYCDLNVPIKQYSTHLKDCQSRTKQCQKCRKPIANKQYLIHQIQCPGFVQQPKPKRQQIPIKYNNYNEYIRNQEVRQQPKYPQQEIKYQYGTKGVKSIQKKEPVNNYNGQNYQERKPTHEFKSLNKESANLGGRPSGQNVGVINRNANIMDQKYGGYPSGQSRIPTYGVSQKQGSSKGIDSKKNIQFNKITTGNQPTGTNKPNIVYPSNYQKNQIKSPIVPPLNSFKPTSYTYNSKQNQIPVNNYPIQNNINPASKNYPVVQDNYKRQIPSSKEVPSNRDGFIKKDSKNVYQYKPSTYNNKPPATFETKPTFESKPSYQSKPTVIERNKKPQQPTRKLPQYQAYEQPINYQNFQDPNPYNPTSFGGHDQDQQLQKAIMASMGIGSNTTSTSTTNNRPKLPSTKPGYKMDQVPADILQKDMMNQSFYDKQRAIMQQIQRGKRRR